MFNYVYLKPNKKFLQFEKLSNKWWRLKQDDLLLLLTINNNLIFKIFTAFDKQNRELPAYYDRNELQNPSYWQALIKILFNFKMH